MRLKKCKRWAMTKDRNHKGCLKKKKDLNGVGGVCPLRGAAALIAVAVAVAVVRGKR